MKIKKCVEISNAETIQTRGVYTMAHRPDTNNIPDPDSNNAWVNRIVGNEIESGDPSVNSRSVGDTVDHGGSRGPSEGYSRIESYEGGDDCGRGSGGWDGI